MENSATRRSFLLALGGGASALWFADSIGAVQDAAAHAQHALTEQQRRFEFFTAVEARVAEGVAARILPNDDGTPGAREAGAVYFMDRIAARHLPADLRGVLRDGLATLAKDTTAKHPAARDFVALTNDEQDTLLHARETTPFFDLMRTLTLGGVLSSQKYGGNRNLVGWKLVRHDPSPTYTSPFGYYDRPGVRRRAGGDA
ncbi:MAG: gluconate 2-dehydrogenase subunit 3 family protein [Gemmatimonadota bacterium]